MTTTIDAVLATARTQLGGYYPGASPYGEWYAARHGAVYRTGQFCAMGLTWCFAQVGGLGIFPEHAYTPSGVAWFKGQGRWHNGTAGAQRGDVVYFDFPGEPHRVSHVGIVESVNSDGSVNTIEFNTSSVVGGDQRNGRTVARKRRSAWVVGYGRPAYATPTTPTPPAPTPVARTDSEEILIMASYPFIIRGTEDDAWTLVLSPTKQVTVPALPADPAARKAQRAAIVAIGGEPRTVGQALATAIRQAVR